MNYNNTRFKKLILKMKFNKNKNKQKKVEKIYKINKKRFIIIIQCI